MQFKHSILALTLLLSNGLAWADTRDNALALFDFVELAYPDLLSPAAPQTQEIQGFYVRYYADSDIYIGVQGDDVWALGEQLQPNLYYAGKVSNFIEITDTDISDALLSNRRANCSYYAESLYSAVQDIQRSILFTGSVNITIDDGYCVITTNSIPNHDFNDNSAAFATDVSTVDAEFRIPIEPSFAATTTGSDEPE